MCSAIVKGNAGLAAAVCAEHLANTQKTILDAVLNPDDRSAAADFVSP